MGRFSFRIPGLQALFPSSSAARAEPAELSDNVQLIHEWPGRAAGLLRVSTQQRLSASNVTPVLNAYSTAENQYIEIFALDLSHDSIATSTLAVFLVDPVGFLTMLAMSTQAATRSAGNLGGFVPFISAGYEGAAAGFDLFSIPRPLIIPANGWSIRVIGQTQGAAYIISSSAVMIVHPVHERPVFV